ncbi:hypothetical protein BGZ57DRAFT_940473 [Hyaloscypha finlandica]|nr:hypothetical protein BGZ57DRAFT_940473 [Hyaloscypha finlandica]
MHRSHFETPVRALNHTEATITNSSAHAILLSSANSARGTLNILWGSLFTIIACTWTVQHLNVPAQRNSCAPGWRGTFKQHMESFYRSVKWMVITMIAPEVVIGMACYDYLSAKKNLQDLEGFALEDDVPWTLTHSYFANIGGFVIQSGPVADSHTETYTSSPDRRLPRHDNNAARNSLPSMISRSENEISYHNPYHLTGRQIWKLRKNNILPSLPQISEAELQDRSKSDAFVKAVALFQILWAIVEVIVRLARKLAISQLELAVIAFAACAVVIYGLHWSKPKSVGATTTIIQYEGPVPQEILQLIKGRHTYMRDLLIADDSTKLRHGSPIRNDAIEIYTDNEAGFWIYLAMILGAMLFGGIHAGAWNFEFPTRAELLLWRCASVWTAVCGPILIMLGILFGYFEKTKGLFVIALPILTFLYVIARLALLVEIVRTLFFLPPDAFVSTWASNIPHVN